MRDLKRWPADELPPEKVQRVLRRLENGDAILRISIEEKVARATIYKIKRGKHASQLRGDDRPQRCKCGAMVMLPCLRCALVEAI